jgi:hypothetical protein
MTVKMNSHVNTYWTADEIAECQSGITPEASRELWEIQSKYFNAGKAKPRGGDGTNGTVEFPEVSDHYADQPLQFWNEITELTQRNINSAFKKENS